MNISIRRLAPWIIGALLLTGLLLRFGSQGKISPTPDSGRVRVVASVFPLADIVRQVAGDRAEVIVLLPPGASPHTYEPTPRQVQELSQAALFVKVGAGLDDWVEKLVRAAGNDDLRCLVAAEGVNLIRSSDEHAHEQADSEAAEEDDHHRHGNPHIWLDPLIVQTIVGRVAAALTAADPDGAAYYSRRAADYRRQLDDLDKDIRAQVKDFRIREYVSFHSAWVYFGRRYGLEEVGVIAETPGSEPAPRQMRDIVAAVRRYRIKAVFAETQFSPAMASAIAADAGARVLMLDPLGGEDIPGRSDYLTLMRYNLEIMKEAMGR